MGALSLAWKTVTFSLFLALLFWTPIFGGEIKIDPRERHQKLIEATEIVASSNPKFMNTNGSLLESIKNGKKKLLFFFASYCNLCKTKMPKFIEVNTALKKCNLDLIAVSFDTTEDEARKALSAWRIILPTVWDRDSKIRRHFKITRVPHLIYIDEKGLILQEASGSNQFKQLINSIEMACKINET